MISKQCICGQTLWDGDRYCIGCGRPVDWNPPRPHNLTMITKAPSTYDMNSSSCHGVGVRQSLPCLKQRERLGSWRRHGIVHKYLDTFNCFGYLWTSANEMNRLIAHVKEAA